MRYLRFTTWPSQGSEVGAAVATAAAPQEGQNREPAGISAWQAGQAGTAHLSAEPPGALPCPPGGHAAPPAEAAPRPAR